MGAKILIIEDDIIIREELIQFLENNGYQTITIDFFSNMVEKIIDKRPDLILLDVNLPEQDGFVLCRKIRHNANIPIIFVTARDSTMDELNGLALGGDDYITKPYNLSLVLARIQNILKRVTVNKEETDIEYQGISLNTVSAMLKFKELSIELSKTELKIMYYLFKHANEIVPRLDLIEHLWEHEIHIDDNTLSVNITRLRKKLESIGISGLIQTKRGMGYKI